jgi:hypothetical protein
MGQRELIGISLKRLITSPVETKRYWVFGEQLYDAETIQNRSFTFWKLDGKK